ncbi:MAG: altronate dehydratase [Clostridiales bacterium]|nr:altronate dehydratase [Clostridiales bacterium]
MTKAIQVHPIDNVAVALAPLACGDKALGVTLLEPIPAGHKFALIPIAQGTQVMKYGLPIGTASHSIVPGAWVHSHNVQTGLDEDAHHTYSPTRTELPSVPLRSFQGFLREDGRAGIRNELWIIPTVGCVNDVCKALELENASLSVQYGLDGLFHFPHPYGCSQMGDDHEQTRHLLAALCRHPNAGGVLVVGLGCENNRMEEFRTLFEPEYQGKLRFMVCQQEEDELTTGSSLLRELAEYASRFQRQPLPASKLVVGMKCGGSDGLSGITANPTVGAFSDKLISMGGSALLTEVPEMFGAESLLFNRCTDETIFHKAVQMVEDFKRYFIDHNQVVYENPSPGNKEGGITTLEDKSMGCVQKGGTAPLVDVLNYGERVSTRGLNLLYGPGNDLVSATALTASGAQLILFTTGRGTPFGAPAPTLKISSNTPLFMKKSHWLDFNAGSVAEGEPLDSASDRLLDLVFRTASGVYQTRAEEHHHRGLAIWKGGVTL